MSTPEQCYATWVTGEDQYHCHRCRLYWGMDDTLDEPICLTWQQVQDATNKRGLAELKRVLK